EGASTTSASVTNIVTANQVFQLSKSEYVVNESNEVVTVTVRRNTGGPATVNFFTRNATAFSAPPGGIGSYHGVTNLLTFPPDVLTTNIEIGIVNDLVNRGDEQFVAWSLCARIHASQRFQRTGRRHHHPFHQCRFSVQHELLHQPGRCR